MGVGYSIEASDSKKLGHARSMAGGHQWLAIRKRSRARLRSESEGRHDDSICGQWVAVGQKIDRSGDPDPGA